MNNVMRDLISFSSRKLDEIEDNGIDAEAPVPTNQVEVAYKKNCDEDSNTYWSSDSDSDYSFKRFISSGIRAVILVPPYPNSVLEICLPVDEE